MRIVTVLAVAALLALAGCTTADKGLSPLEQREGATPGTLPNGMKPNGTMPNGLLPEPWGDTT